MRTDAYRWGQSALQFARKLIAGPPALQNKESLMIRTSKYVFGFLAVIACAFGQERPLVNRTRSLEVVSYTSTPETTRLELRNVSQKFVRTISVAMGSIHVERRVGSPFGKGLAPGNIESIDFG